MKWELDALKILARNDSVPGVALKDTISEIEKLKTRIEAYQKTLKALRIAGDELVDAAMYGENIDEAITNWHKAQGV